ncbi:MAG: H-type lectin domain-containing protein [Rhodobacteraceae bacterium]|nr:H-type lectin domain-containing protein [Paracoccaceae bacterium]
MRRIASHLVGVDSGSVVLFSDFQDGGVMWTGEGPRELRRAVSFAEPFREAPVVQVTMSMWDMDQKTNQRADISAAKVTPEGFVIVFRTWGDTRVARVRADWLAIGEAIGDDDWEIE